MSPDAIPAWAVFVVPGIGILLWRGSLLDHVVAAAEEYGVTPDRASALTTRTVTVLSSAFLAMGAIQWLGNVPNPMCLYTLTPVHWPVVATWILIGSLWTTILLWLWRGREPEVLLLLSGMLPKTSIMVYRLGALVFVVLTMALTLSLPTGLGPCVWQ